jgi:hypothetical protein
LTQRCNHELKKVAAKDCMSWALWGGVVVTVMSINRKEPYRGVVKCQVIMVVYVLSNLMKR